MHRGPLAGGRVEEGGGEGPGEGPAAVAGAAGMVRGAGEGKWRNSSSSSIMSAQLADTSQGNDGRETIFAEIPNSDMLVLKS